MSEVLVRMEIPKSCFGCPLSLAWMGKIRCRIGKDSREGDLDFRPDWCPIICSLPEGHGRLIDAHELFYNMFVMADGRVLPNYDCDNFHIDMHVKDIKRRILETPTIVPAERSET